MLFDALPLLYPSHSRLLLIVLGAGWEPAQAGLNAVRNTCIVHASSFRQGPLMGPFCSLQCRIAVSNLLKAVVVIMCHPALGHVSTS